MYVDTNVFVYAMIHAERVEEARVSKKILTKIAKGELEACTASLTWDELVWTARRIEGADVAKQKGAEFLRFPNLKILSVDGVLGLAQKLVETYDIGPRDAIHVACALKSGVKEVVSDDRGLDRIKEIRRVTLKSAAE